MRPYLSRLFGVSLDLFVRTIKAKYRKSFLGYFWLVAPVLLVSVTATLAANAGVINMQPAGGLPPFLAIIVAVVIWLSFADMLEGPTRAIEDARPYLTRVKVPVEAIIIVQLGETAIALIIRLLLVTALLIAFSHFSAVGGATLVVSVVSASLFGIGIGALLAPFMILFTDLRDVVRYVPAYGIFLTTTFYEPRAGVFGAILTHNPLSVLIDATRASIAQVQPDFPASVATSALCGLALTAAGIALFRVSVPIIIERMLIGGR